MGNIIDYARTETRDFDALAFREADALVLAQLSYDDVPECVPRLAGVESRYGTLHDRVKEFDPRHPIRSMRMLRKPPFGGVTIARADDELHHGSAVPDHDVENVGLVDPQVTHDFYHAIAANPRFSGIEMGAFLEEFDGDEQTQFAAVTYRLPSGMLVVAFRGTDDSLVGWKEDFNMSVRCPVPSQTQAVEYYRSIDERASSPFAARPASIALGGHSKGGNLAVYTAMRTQSPHIARIFSHDGPGFMREVTQSAAFKAIEPRVEKTVPEASVIGMLMSTVSRYDIVETNVSGIMQHMGLNWRIDDGEFVTKPELSPVSRLLDRTLDAWMEQFTNEERARAVDQCYDIIASAGYTSFAELADHMGEALPVIAEAARKTDEATRSLILNIIKALPATAAKSLFREWADEKDQHTQTRPGTERR